MMKAKSQKEKTRDLAYMGMGLALAIVAAKISLPAEPIPLSMQTFAVILTALLLGAKRAVLVQSTYLLLGLLGLPVFASGGGPDYILRPSFGYLLGFVAAAGLSASLFDRLRFKIKSAWSFFFSSFLSGMAGLVSLYFIGVSYLFFISRFYLGSEQGLLYFISVGAWIFLPKDALSVFLSAVAASTLIRLIPPLRQERGWALRSADHKKI